MIGESFIQFEVYPVTEIPDANWVFFTSPQSVRSVCEQVELSKNIQIAVLGKGTAKALAEFGLKADFTGVDSDTHQVAQDFLSHIGNQTVYLPVGKQTLGVLEAVIPADQLIKQTVYDTLSKSVKLEGEPDVLVFTSPSNVASYLQQFQLKSYQRIIAIGNTTADFILSESLGVEVDISDYPNEAGLAEQVLG